MSSEGGLTTCFKKYICCLIANPKRNITYAWLVSLLLVLIAFIVACVAAGNISNSRSDKDAEAGQVASFAAMWTALLLVTISFVGTIIMRRFQTALAIGYFLGVIFVMSHQMLIIFAIFVERSQLPGETDAVRGSQQAVAVFAFFLFIVYSAFGSMLAVFRNDIIKEEVHQEDLDVQEDMHAEQLQEQY